MFDFGDELTLESYRIPWLIWVQLVVTILLILLLYCLSSVSLQDPTNDPNLNSSSSSSSSRFVSIDKSRRRDSTVITANLSQISQVGKSKSLKGEIVEGTSSRRVVVRREVGGGDEEREDRVSSGPTVNFHPCFYFRLARTMFLKCLGLDSAADSPSTTERRKNKDE